MTPPELHSPEGDKAILQYVLDRLDGFVKGFHHGQLDKTEVIKGIIITHELLAGHFGLPRKFEKYVSVDVKKLQDRAMGLEAQNKAAKGN